MSIVEGNRQKFQLEESDVQERKNFIESTRRQIVALRDEVQGAAMTPGFSTKSSGSKVIPSIGSNKSKGYGKVGTGDDEMTPASDIEMSGGRSMAGGAAVRESNEDEILGAEPENSGVGHSADPSRGRHRKKKCCLGVCVLLLLLGGAAAAFFVAKGGSPSALKEKLKEKVKEATGGRRLAALTLDTIDTTNGDNNHLDHASRSSFTLLHTTQGAYTRTIAIRPSC